MDYIRERPKGWEVSFATSNDGEVEVLARKLFTFHLHGGKAKSLRLAKTWRDETRARLGKPKRAMSRSAVVKAKSRNGGAKVGVCMSPRLNSWIVSWSERKNPKKKHFYFDNNQASKDAAYLAASQLRDEMVELHYEH